MSTGSTINYGIMRQFGPQSYKNEYMSLNKYRWDLQSALKTDGCGPKDVHADAVDVLYDFYDFLEDKTPNKITHKLCGTLLWKHLSGVRMTVPRRPNVKFCCLSMVPKQWSVLGIAVILCQ